MIQGWYCEEKLDSGHSKRSKGSWGHCRILLKVCVFSTFSITCLTYNVVVVFICRSCTEVYPVSLANLLDLFRWSRETKETWMKLYNRRNMYLIREKAVGILNGIKKKKLFKGIAIKCIIRSTLDILLHSLDIIPRWINCYEQGLKLCTKCIFALIYKNQRTQWRNVNSNNNNNNNNNNKFCNLKLHTLNPFTPKISLAILPTICHKILMISIWRIWYYINL